MPYKIRLMCPDCGQKFDNIYDLTEHLFEHYPEKGKPSISRVLLSKAQKLDWITPYPLFRQLNDEFHFELDAATCKHNLMGTPHYYIEGQDGLNQPWRNPTWVNPPYNSRNITKWLEKAQMERYLCRTSVFLLPARTSTRWFHKYIWDDSLHVTNARVELRFIKGRLLFHLCKHCHPDYDPSTQNTAPFDSMIVIFRG